MKISGVTSSSTVEGSSGSSSPMSNNMGYDELVPEDKLKKKTLKSGYAKTRPSSSKFARGQQTSSLP